MLLIILLGVVFFTGIILSLVMLILFARSKLVSTGDISITINGDKEISAKPGSSLLSVLANENIFVSSACGGGDLRSM